MKTNFNFISPHLTQAHSQIKESEKETPLEADSLLLITYGSYEDFGVLGNYAVITTFLRSEAEKAYCDAVPVELRSLQDFLNQLCKQNILTELSTVVLAFPDISHPTLEGHFFV